MKAADQLAECFNKLVDRASRPGGADATAIHSRKCSVPCSPKHRHVAAYMVAQLLDDCKSQAR